MLLSFCKSWIVPPSMMKVPKNFGSTLGSQLRCQTSAVLLLLQLGLRACVNLNQRSNNFGEREGDPIASTTALRNACRTISHALYPDRKCPGASAVHRLRQSRRSNKRYVQGAVWPMLRTLLPPTAFDSGF